jgi:serine/threonine protein kinase
MSLAIGLSQNAVYPNRASVPAFTFRLPQNTTVQLDPFQARGILYTGEQLGSGTVALVYSASMIGEEEGSEGKAPCWTPVALKVARRTPYGDNNAVPFLREEHMLRLTKDNPFVVNLLRSFSYQLTPFYPAYRVHVLERMDESLHDRLKRGPFCKLESGSLIAQFLDGLGALRKCSIFHNDLKPGNILLRNSRDGATPTLKISDFDASGIADLNDNRPFNGDHTTASYRSLNLSARGLHNSFDDDLWAAACTIYEMTVRELLFQFEYNKALDERTYSYVLLKLHSKLLGCPSRRVLTRVSQTHDVRLAHDLSTYPLMDRAARRANIVARMVIAQERTRSNHPMITEDNLENRVALIEALFNSDLTEHLDPTILKQKFLLLEEITELCEQMEMEEIYWETSREAPEDLTSLIESEQSAHTRIRLFLRGRIEDCGQDSKRGKRLQSRLAVEEEDHKKVIHFVQLCDFADGKVKLTCRRKQRLDLLEDWRQDTLHFFTA